MQSVSLFLFNPEPDSIENAPPLSLSLSLSHMLQQTHIQTGACACTHILDSGSQNVLLCKDAGQRSFMVSAAQIRSQLLAEDSLKGGAKNGTISLPVVPPHLVHCHLYAAALGPITDRAATLGCGCTVSRRIQVLSTGLPSPHVDER